VAAAGPEAASSMVLSSRGKDQAPARPGARGAGGGTETWLWELYLLPVPGFILLPGGMSLPLTLPGSQIGGGGEWGLTSFLISSALWWP
jgi:hypothetical protein